MLTLYKLFKQSTVGDCNTGQLISCGWLLHDHQKSQQNLIWLFSRKLQCITCITILTDRPGMLDFKGKAKWDAWNSIKGNSCCMHLNLTSPTMTFSLRLPLNHFDSIFQARARQMRNKSTSSLQMIWWRNTAPIGELEYFVIFISVYEIVWIYPVLKIVYDCWYIRSLLMHGS